MDYRPKRKNKTIKLIEEHIGKKKIFVFINWVKAGVDEL